MDPHAVSPDACVVMYADGPKWGNGNPLCGIDRPPDITTENSLDAIGSELGEGVMPSSTSPLPY